MRDDERRLLDQRALGARQAARRLTAAALIGGAALLALLVGLFSVARRDLLGPRARRSRGPPGPGATEHDPAQHRRRRPRDRPPGPGHVPESRRRTPDGLDDRGGHRAAGRGGVPDRQRSQPRRRREPRAAGDRATASSWASPTTRCCSTRDGREIPIADSGAPIHDAQGAVAGVVLVFRDIADQREADRANQRLAAIVASADFAVVGETVANVITDWNPGAEALFGFTAAEMIGRQMSSAGAARQPRPVAGADPGAHRRPPRRRVRRAPRHQGRTLAGRRRHALADPRRGWRRHRHFPTDPRRHRAAQAEPRDRRSAAAGRGGERGQGPVPRDAVPRAPHAADARDGVRAPARAPQRPRPGNGRIPGHDPAQRRARGAADRRPARPDPHRARQGDARPRAARPAPRSLERGAELAQRIPAEGRRPADEPFRGRSLLPSATARGSSRSSGTSSRTPPSSRPRAGA